MLGVVTFTDSWEHFQERLDASFDDPNRKETALKEFREKVQKDLTADKFFQQLDGIIKRAGLTDDSIICDQLKRAMNIEVVRGVLRSTPVPTKYEDWKKKAIEIDRGEQQIRAIQRGRPFIPQPRSQQQQAPPAWRQVAVPHVDKREATGVTFGGAGQPMDVSMNEACRRRACWICGQEGHFQNKCPQGKPIIQRMLEQMAPGERRILADELGAMKESAFEEVVDTRRSTVEEYAEEEDEDEEVVDSQGFASGQA